MTHLNQSELHAHRTSCLSGGEFPCHVTLAPELEPLDPLWDEPIPLSLPYGTENGLIPARPSAAGKDHVSQLTQEAF